MAAVRNSCVPAVHSRSLTRFRRTLRYSRLISSHISELISSRTWRAFSRAAPMHAAIDSRFARSTVARSSRSSGVLASHGGGSGSAASNRPQWRAASAGARSSVRLRLTFTTRAMCSARSRYRLIQ